MFHPQVHKALADKRHKEVHDGLAKSLGRSVLIEGDWFIVETEQFRKLRPEEQSLVVDTLHAGFPEYLITQGYRSIFISVFYVSFYSDYCSTICLINTGFFILMNIPSVKIVTSIPLQGFTLNLFLTTPTRSRVHLRNAMANFTW